MVFKGFAFILALLTSNTVFAFLKDAKIFCTQTDVQKKILRQTEPMSAYRHGDNYAFLIFQKQRDLSLMFDRIGDFVSTQKINPQHVYDKEVEGFALAPKDTLSFFNYARKNNTKLNSQEQKLLASLMQDGSVALEKNSYILKKPVYMAAAHKACGSGTAEHELNHMYFDSSGKYRADVKKIYARLKKAERSAIVGVLKKMGYDAQTLSVEDNLIGEFSAFFRDIKTLNASYLNEISTLDPIFLNKVSTSLLALEKENSLFAQCPDGSDPATVDEDTSNAEKI